MKETRDMENFIFDVEEAEEIKPEEDKTIIADVKFHLRTWADKPLYQTEYRTYTSTCY